MGKRKVTTLPSSGRVEEQCDVWLTAKRPKKQKVLSREPLSIIHTTHIHDEPMFTAPSAVKQTTLIDFFKQPREIEADPFCILDERTQNVQEPEIHERDSPWVLPDSQSAPQNAALVSTVKHVVESFTQQQTSKSATLISDTDSTSHYQDEYDRNKENHGNINHVERHQPCASVKKTSPHRILESENSKLKSASDDGLPGSSKSCCQRTSYSCKCKDTVLKLNNVGGCGIHEELTQIPYSSISPSVTYPSQSLRSKPVTGQSYRVTFVPEEGESFRCSQLDKPLKTSFASKGADVTSSGDDQSAWSNEYSAPGAETQSSLSISKLRYIDPELLDTAPMPFSQTENTDQGQSILRTDTIPESDIDLHAHILKFVDPQLLQANTMEMSTERCDEELSGDEALSSDDQSADGRALTQDQSPPPESLDFTIDTQGCLVLKRLTDDYDDDDSQSYY